VATLLDHLAMVHDQDDVGRQDGRETVGMTSEVRPSKSGRSATWIKCSDSESRLEVASSRIRTRGSLRMTRAMATRCFSPPLNRCPRSPTTVS